MKRWFLILYFSFAAMAGFCQNILLEEHVDDTVIGKTGPNLKQFTHSFLGYGFVAGPNEGNGASIGYGRSSSFSAGIKHKRKICPWYSVGVGIAFQQVSFHLNQNSAKILPNKIIHDQEKFLYNNAELELFNRFNFGKRGNVLGNFVDVGAYGNWAFSVKHIYRDKLSGNDPSGAKVSQVKNSGLLYTQPFNFGMTARIGIDRFSLTGRYRISDLFKPEFGFPELPRFLVGLEIAIYN